MIFSVSNEPVEWCFDSGPDSVTLTVKDLLQHMTITFQEIFLAAWSSLLSQRQNFLNNHLAPVPITPNQQGTMEMRIEVLSSEVSQKMNTCGYQVSDLKDIEFHYWEVFDLEMDAVFRPGKENFFSLTIFNDFEMVSIAASPNLIEVEKRRGEHSSCSNNSSL